MKCGLAEEEVEEGSIVGLDDKEENLLRWNFEESRANDDVWRIGPYPGMDEIGIPWRSGYDSNLM